MLETAAVLTLGAFGALLAYAYAGYPALLLLVGRKRPARPAPERASLPSVTILVAVYNEEAQIRETIESLLRLDYPADRRQILIVSDASTDRTDEIVREYADRGVELIRLEARGGKTTAENAAAAHIRGSIVVNTDASTRIRPDALIPMISAFADPSVAVVSGTDVSVSVLPDDATRGEASYVAYEMWVRELETRAGGIVGASGCFFAIRAELQRLPAPPHLSRDFAAALVAREKGYHAISLPSSVCYVPRSLDARSEFRRKVRTFTRGMETLHHKRRLLNPTHDFLFAWKLFSHKVARWLIPWAALAAWLALALLAPSHRVALVAFGVMTAAIGLGLIGWRISTPGRRLPRVLAMPAYALIGNAAVLQATIRALQGEQAPTWEPTRRRGYDAPPTARGADAPVRDELPAPALERDQAPGSA